MKDGSARRMELLNTNHRLVTFDRRSLTASMSWFTGALDALTGLAPSNHIYWIKEVLVLLAMLSALASMLPLFLILTRFKFFESLALPLAEKPKMLAPKKRWSNVLFAMLISGLTFPFLTQLIRTSLPG